MFWYSKLYKLEGLSPTYQERFIHALSQTSMPKHGSKNANKYWLSQIKRDYKVDKKSKNKRFRNLDFLQHHNTNNRNQNIKETTKEAVSLNSTDKSIRYDYTYEIPISVTADGKTAYFSKASFIKPSTGIFSKKQRIYKTYSAKKVNGEWGNSKEVALCPKYYSAIHPTISADGKRLFFASNMPGTFGKYDIYVSDLKADGSFGIAKNLGTKVNTKKNDLYPKLINGTSLLFASDGRKGFGGLDVYMVHVKKQKVGWSTNLGNAVNSPKDDFAIALNGNGKGYVVSNRGRSKKQLQHIALSLKPTNKNPKNNLEFNTTDVLHTQANPTDYTSTVFKNE